MTTGYITDYLAANVVRFADKPALVFEGTTLTWSQLTQQVYAAAAVLAVRLPKEEQAIVGILLPNTPEFVVTYLAVIHAGHIAMPLDPNFKGLEVQAVLESMQPAFTVAGEQYADCFRPSDTVITPASLQTASLSDAEPVEPIAYLRLSPETQAASMLFTSGTTGHPKSVPYTHRNHMWNITAVSELWKWTADDTILLSLPLSHWHGLVMALDGAMYHGNTVYLQTWFDPETTLELLTSGKISLFMHVPIAYSKLIAHNPGTTYDISSVRLCISGSSFLPPKLWHQFKDRFGQDILERYGANEMGLIASNFLDERLPGSVGVPLQDVEIQIRPDGEIAMKSPGLFPGYWKNDEATAKQRTDDGFWLSGDIGELDDNGRIWLKGRVQEKMKKSGYTVYPRDVEWALMKHPDVHEVVVMSIQQENELSDTFVYFVVGDVTDKEIFSFAKEQMPFFWRPDKIIHLEAIPKTGRTSKPAIRELRAMVEP